MALNEMNNITTSGSYPGTAGVRMGMSSTIQTYYPTVLMEITLTISGTVGTSPVYGVEVQDRNGDWVLCPDFNLTDKGTVTAIVEGCAYRGNFTNGSGAGSGTSAPRYLLQSKVFTDRMSLGDYVG